MQGSLSAVQTLLERYPVLLSADKMEITTSLNLLLNVLRLLGYGDEQFRNMLSSLWSQKVLDTIEKSIKLLLKANLTKLFTCSMSPWLPGWLFDEGVNINLEEVDYFGLFDCCPAKGNEGSYRYFDNDMKVSELWQSRDFNAFVWYVINRGSKTWDNRNSVYDLFDLDSTTRKRFMFDTAIGQKIPGPAPESKPTEIVKKGIVEVSYEGLKTGEFGRCHVLNVKPDSSYMGSLRKDGSEKKIGRAKLWEFNNDYIDSIKLFDSSTLAAEIVSEVLNIGGSVSLSYRMKKNEIAAMVRHIVKSVMHDASFGTVSDCYFRFDNSEYDEELKAAAEKHEGKYKYVNGKWQETDAEGILSAFEGLKGSAEQKGDTERIKGFLSDILDTTETVSEGVTGTNAGFDLKFSLIEDLLNETVVEIILHVLTPKFAILLIMNAAVAGVDRTMTWEKFLKNFQNVLIRTIQDILSIIIDYIMNDVVRPALAELREALMVKLAREQREFYAEILASLVCIGVNFGKGKCTNLAIDNVAYADILPTTDIDTPKEEC